jgi:hypothetical protein
VLILGQSVGFIAYSRNIIIGKHTNKTIREDAKNVTCSRKRNNQNKRRCKECY